MHGSIFVCSLRGLSAFYLNFLSTSTEGTSRLYVPVSLISGRRKTERENISRGGKTTYLWSNLSIRGFLFGSFLEKIDPFPLFIGQ